MLCKKTFIKGEEILIFSTRAERFTLKQEIFKTFFGNLKTKIAKIFYILPHSATFTKFQICMQNSSKRGLSSL